jgi:hypothetical protein
VISSNDKNPAFSAKFASFLRDSLKASSFSSCISRSLGAVIELGRAGAFVRRHFRRLFERAAIGKVGGDAGRPEDGGISRRSPPFSCFLSRAPAPCG